MPTVSKRNANAFSPNAIVDVCRRREMIFFISKTTKPSNFNISHSIALDNLYLHFRGKCRHQLLPVGSKSHKPVHFGSCSGGDFSITVQLILKQFTVLETDSRASFSLVQPIRHVCSNPENGARVGLPSSTRYANG